MSADMHMKNNRIDRDISDTGTNGSMRLIPADRTNYRLAVDIQNSIFPNENGTLNILASLDRDLFMEKTGLVYPDHHVRYWLAEVNGEYTGITGLYYYDDDPDTVWLGWFGILPEHRRHGYGRTLLEKTLEMARTEGFGHLRLYTDYGDNHNAVLLYEQEGFIGERYTAETLEYDCRIYSKCLGEGGTILWNDRFLDLAYQSKLDHMGAGRLWEIIRIYNDMFP